MRSVGSHVYGTGLGGPDCGPADCLTLCGNPVSLERGGGPRGVESPGLLTQLSQEGRKRRRCWVMHTLAWHLRQLRQRLPQKRHKTLTPHCAGTCRHLSLNSEKRNNASQLLPCSFGLHWFSTDTGSTGKQPWVTT